MSRVSCKTCKGFFQIWGSNLCGPRDDDLTCIPRKEGTSDNLHKLLTILNHNRDVKVL